MLEKPKGTIKNGPMQRQWKYWAYKTQNEDKEIIKTHNTEN